MFEIFLGVLCKTLDATYTVIYPVYVLRKMNIAELYRVPIRIFEKKQISVDTVCYLFH